MSSLWARRVVDSCREPLAAWQTQHPVLGGLAVAALTACGLTLWQSVFDRIVPTIDGWEIYWPFNGITIAFMLLCRRRQWPWILAGFFCAFAAAELIRHEPLGEVATDVLSNMAEVFLAAFFLPPFHFLERWLLEPRLLPRFVWFGVVLGPGLTCFPVGIYFGHRFPISLWSYASLWGFSDALGAALWIPLILILFSHETYDLFRWRALPQTLALLIGLCTITWIAFSQNSYPIGFLPYPLLLLVALRLGFSGAVIGANLLTVIVASRSLHHIGPFRSYIGPWHTEHTVVVQVFSTLAVLFVFPLSVAKVERKNFEERLSKAYEDMKQLATIDPLTGLANRRHFDQMLEREWGRAIRSTTHIGLLMIDADYFKGYNDRYGHVAGDDCLRRIATILADESLRRHDLIARYGGEEFAVLLPGSNAHHLKDLAERLRIDIVAAEILHEGNPHNIVTISVGCASRIPRLNDPPEELIDAADRALYEAKQSGRNRICCYGEASTAAPLANA